MKKEWIVRAWKDPAFRTSLSAEERAALPESPSGRSLLEESELVGIIGGLGVVVETARGCSASDPTTCGLMVCCWAPEEI